MDGAKRLLLCVCTLIVAVFHAQFVVAAAAYEDAPVPGGTEAFARALGIDPSPDRGRFMFVVTRLVYETGEVRNPAVAAFLQSIRQRARLRMPLTALPEGSELVPVPLTADVWGDAIFHRRVTRDELVATIISDRSASQLCHGLGALDDATLEFFADHRSLLSRLYERSAPMFAAFGGSVRVRDGEVIPPGGAGAVPLWEAVVGEKVARAERFLAALFELSEGRIAYLYNIAGELDPARRAFLLGSWMPNAQTRLERFKTLASTGIDGIREWHVRTLPFGRSSYDLGMAIIRLSVADDGTPAEPSSRAMWARVFGGPEPSEDGPVDAAWLAESLATDVRQRGERLDQIGFAQRVLGRISADRGDEVFLLRSLPRFRALLLTFERVGIENPAVYASTVRHAAKLAILDGRRGYVAQSLFQGSLALVCRMAQVHTLDVPAVERLVGRLVATPIVDGIGYAGGIARWWRDDVYRALPPASNLESALIAALSGRAADVLSARRVTWEGQQYRLDLAAAERNRLERVREKQRAPAIDLPMQLADTAHFLVAAQSTIDDLQDAAMQFAAVAEDLPEQSREEEADDVPNGVAPPSSAHEILRKATEELTKAARNKDPKRAPRLAEPIVELADDLLARNLLSFVYAVSLGDPDGTVLLAADVSHRHDFGFGLKDNDMRARLAWAVPRPEVAPNVPWHVSGSLLGLDVALSTLALRRVATDHALEAPKLTSNARDTFATSIALLDPLALSDADRDRIADAIERGRRRAAAVDAAGLDAIAAEIGLDAARLRAIRWTFAHERTRLPAMLSFTELLTLGGVRASELHAWGMAVLAANGCFCSRVLPPGTWRTLSGRPQLGLAASVVPDVNFRVAMVLKDLDLPAPLAKVVLSAAMQDFIDEARPTDDDDWLSLSRAAAAITRERVEDYVAAATATGPLMPDTGRTPELMISAGRFLAQSAGGGRQFEPSAVGGRRSASGSRQVADRARSR